MTIQGHEHKILSINKSRTEVTSCAPAPYGFIQKAATSIDHFFHVCFIYSVGLDIYTLHDRKLLHLVGALITY